MELDQNLLKKINSLDDETLRASIGKIAAEMGVEERKAKHYLSDMSKIKQAVNSLTQTDFDKITAALGAEKTEQLMENIRSEMKEKGD